MREAGTEYPVVSNDPYATRNAHDNGFWPTIYPIFVRYKHLGEGA